MPRPLANGCIALLLALTTGFAWPTTGERLVRTLTEATSSRERRDALRQLAERAELRAPHVVSAIATLLRDGDPAVREDALRALVRVQPEQATEQLARALDDEAASVRRAALSLSMESGRELPPTALLEALRDAAPEVRVEGARALVASPDPAVSSALARALDDPALEVRVAAAHALARQQSGPAREALLRRVTDPLPELRAAVMTALACWSDDEVAAVVRMGLRDPDQLIATAAQRATRKLARRASLAAAPSASPEGGVGGQLELDGPREPEPRSSEQDWLALLEQSADERLAGAREQALLDALERTLPPGEARAGEPLLLWLLRARPLPVRRRLAALIERSQASVSSAILRPLLEERDLRVRVLATRLLARAADRGADARLLAQLSAPQPLLRSAALAALSPRLHPDHLERLVEQLERAEGEPSETRLRLLADGLPRMEQRPSLAFAERLCRALGPALTASDERRASLALRSLGQLEGECARALVRSAARDPRVGRRLAAVRALVRDRSSSARALRRSALAADDARVASTALVAMVLAADPLPEAWLRARLQGAAWPLGPAAAFALSSVVLKRTRPPEQIVIDALCEGMHSGEPVTRSNLALALSSLQTVHCGPHRPQPMAASMAVSMVSAPTAPGAARALLLVDGRLLVSLPDGSGSSAWPDVAVRAELSAWFDDYGSLH